MRTVRRLRLRCFLLFTSLLMCCPLIYLLPCRIYFRPIIKILSLLQCHRPLNMYQLFHLAVLLIMIHLLLNEPNLVLNFPVTSSRYLVHSYTILMVDLAGFAPASRTLFSLLHTAILFMCLLYINMRAVSSISCPFLGYK